MLLDNSLLVSRVETPVDPADDKPRFTMLETIREYATGRLESSGEAEEIRRAHALYYLALAEAPCRAGSTRVGGAAPGGVCRAARRARRRFRGYGKWTTITP